MIYTETLKTKIVYPLREKRLAKGLKLKDYAQITGYSMGFISLVELERYYPKMKTAKNLIQSLKKYKKGEKPIAKVVGLN